MERTMRQLSSSVVWLVLAAVSCSESTGPAPPSALAVEVVASGYNSPVFLTAPAGDPRLYVVEKYGYVRMIIDDERVLPPFLDITDRVSAGGEQGLFSIAFHPDYASNGFLYASYTHQRGTSRIERYSFSPELRTADPNSAVPILDVGQMLANHNGGLIAFGPDGNLYIGFGDGGGSGDPAGSGQNSRSLLGALLRIDVDAGDPYAVPTDNPFVDDPAARDEIWAYGLRNPWRFSFDSTENDLYIADVGENLWEEINVVSAFRPGLNYGWNIMEGAHCFQAENCDMSDLVLPALEYPHSEGCAVIGGYVYRGQAISGLQGHYLYSDYCAGFLRSFRFANGRVTDEREWNVGDLGRVVSFGEDAAGELYILSENGNVYRIIEAK